MLQYFFGISENTVMQCKNTVTRLVHPIDWSIKKKGEKKEKNR